VATLPGKQIIVREGVFHLTLTHIETPLKLD